MATRSRIRKYVHSWIDDRGGKAKARFSFRKRGFRQIPLPGIPGSVEFEQAYAAALAGVSPLPSTVGAKRIRAGSLDAAAIAWFNSPSFLGLSPATQKAYRKMLESFCAEHGSKPIALLTQKHIEAIYTKKLSTPAAANTWLRLIKMLMKFAKREGLVRIDPAHDIDLVKRKSAGFPCWSESDIEQYEKYHPIGSRARLAFALLLFLGQRRSDIVRLGWPDVGRDGVIRFTQKKTGQDVANELHPELRHIINASQIGIRTFITTPEGKPYTSGGFGVWFKSTCAEAGLPDHCTAHGLRKAFARRGAEANLGAPTIAAMGGWRSLKEVQHYCDAADRELMARQGTAAMAKGAKENADRTKKVATATNGSGNGRVSY